MKITRTGSEVLTGINPLNIVNINRAVTSPVQKQILYAPDTNTININIAVTTDITIEVVQINTQVGGTLTINAPVLTPSTPDCLNLIFKITSANIQTYAWDAIFAGGKPSITSGGGIQNMIGFQYDKTANKFYCLANI